MFIFSKRVVNSNLSLDIIFWGTFSTWLEFSDFTFCKWFKGDEATGVRLFGTNLPAGLNFTSIYTIRYGVESFHITAPALASDYVYYYSEGILDDWG